MGWLETLAALAFAVLAAVVVWQIIKAFIPGLSE